MPRNNIGEIARTWTFESSSGSGLYETIQYVDGTTPALSCDCKGWTRRIDSNGQRSCKHTRWVEEGVADRHAIGSKNYAPVAGQRQQPSSRMPDPPPRMRPSAPVPATPPPSRFKPTQKQEEPPKRRRFERVEVDDDADLVDGDRFKRL